MYRWSVQGPGASFTSSLGILAVVGMGAYLLETDANFTTGQFFAFLLYANMFYEPVEQTVSINNLVSMRKLRAKGSLRFWMRKYESKTLGKLVPSLFRSHH